MQFLDKVYKVQKQVAKHGYKQAIDKWGPHSKLLDKIWLMVPSTASYMHFKAVLKVRFLLNNVYKTLKHVMKQVKS